MLDNAYGAGKAGTGQDFAEFVKLPRTWVRAGLFISHLIALAAQASQSHDSLDKCIFYHQPRCNLQMIISVLGFFTTILFTIVDYFFVDISSASKRKKVCQAELGMDAGFIFFTFVSFCAIVVGWNDFPNDSEGEEVRQLYVSSARTIMTFSCFTIPLWSSQFYFCFRNYRQGVLSAFAPVIGDSMANPYDSIPDPASHWEQNEFQPTPFSNTFSSQTAAAGHQQIY